MELFDKKFVYLEWDDVLKGKKVLAGDNLQFMRKDVNDGTGKFMCVEAYNNSSNSSELYPFKDDNGTTWALVYYDQNYSCKRAYVQGKTIQYKPKDSSTWWADCVFEPKWSDACEYRVKPEKKCRPFKDIAELKQAWDAKRSPLVHPELEEHTIWVRDKKRPDITRLITGFNGGIQCVALAGQWCTLEALFDEYEFLDGTPCGVEEEE